MEHKLKKCESLYCTPEAYIILYINYTSKKKVKMYYFLKPTRSNQVFIDVYWASLVAHW